MAYSHPSLHRVGTSDSAAPTLWTYTSADPIADVNTEGYFNDASADLTVRDIIFVIDSSTPTATIVNVLSNAAGVVDVSDGLTIPETDAD